MMAGLPTEKDSPLAIMGGETTSFGKHHGESSRIIDPMDYSKVSKAECKRRIDLKLKSIQVRCGRNLFRKRCRM